MDRGPRMDLLITTSSGFSVILIRITCLSFLEIVLSSPKVSNVNPRVRSFGSFLPFTLRGRVLVVIRNVTTRSSSLSMSPTETSLMPSSLVTLGRSSIVSQSEVPFPAFTPIRRFWMAICWSPSSSLAKISGRLSSVFTS